MQVITLYKLKLPRDQTSGDDGSNKISVSDSGNDKMTMEKRNWSAEQWEIWIDGSKAILYMYHKELR